MITWGMSANSHNAAVAVFDNDQLVFATETERWSGIKNDPHLNRDLNNYLFSQNLGPDKIIWYEKPRLKMLRQWTAGQGLNWYENNIEKYISDFLYCKNIEYTSHHHSHAAAGYYTSGFDNACVVVIDAIGEFETLTIWQGHGNKLTKIYSQHYPHSIGLWYSAMTQRIGLKPNEDEYILMGMAAYGDPIRLESRISKDFIHSYETITFNKNLHRGCLDWAPDLTERDYFDIAAATQRIYEKLFDRVLNFAKSLVPSKNLVLMGGCALNCSANSQAYRYFKNLWIMPAPGDSGSAIGAVLAKTEKHILWPGPYLGYDIPTQHNNEQILQELLTTGICGVARGPAEFGPRALGNRSLLADPRTSVMKEKVNSIKQRQQFRPFAPAILEEYAKDYFHMPVDSSPYMQLVVKCRNPDEFPAVVHVDGTSRVQTVSKDSNPEFYQLLKMWNEKTGCPILLNTSLNIKGQPIVNNQTDCCLWEQTYGVKIFN